jgi:hypothetical protein
VRVHADGRVAVVSEITKAVYLVHWPGKATPACDAHLEKLFGLATVLGFQLTWTPLVEEMECANCASEAKKAVDTRTGGLG